MNEGVRSWERTKYRKHLSSTRCSSSATCARYAPGDVKMAVRLASKSQRPAVVKILTSDYYYSLAPITITIIIYSYYYCYSFQPQPRSNNNDKTIYSYIPTST